MTRATPAMRQLAARLIACETNDRKSSGLKIPVALAVCEKLQPQLATLMGNAGFRALLARARALAGEEVSWLGKVEVSANGTLEHWDELQARCAPKDAAEGTVVLLAQLLGLLVTFIGEALTVRLVREVWPKF